MMYGRNLARHWHRNIYGGMVSSLGVLCFVPTLVNV